MMEKKKGLTKKQRSRIYWAVFFIVVIILFIVNNTDNYNGEGPYPPFYKQNKTTQTEKVDTLSLQK